MEAEVPQSPEILWSLKTTTEQSHSPLSRRERISNTWKRPWIHHSPCIMRAHPSFCIIEMALMHPLSLYLIAVQHELRPKVLLLGNHSTSVFTRGAVFFLSNLTEMKRNEKFWKISNKEIPQIKNISRTVIGFKERSPILWSELNLGRGGDDSLGVGCIKIDGLYYLITERCT